jgi:hypothetical protein
MNSKSPVIDLAEELGYINSANEDLLMKYPLKVGRHLCAPFFGKKK